MGVHAAFPNTPWSILADISKAESSEGREAAVNYLCSHYWYPLYAFARWKGLRHHDAQDQTQAFLARLVERDSFSCADPERGKFRSFLLSSFQNHLTNHWHRENAQRRGGGVEVLALEMFGAEERFRQDQDTGSDPAAAFDRVWALAVLEACLKELAESYRTQGKAEEFAVLRSFLSPLDVSGTTLAAAAAQLGLSDVAMRQRVSRARMRFSNLLRKQVATLLADPTPEEIQAEMEYLRDALRRH